MATSSGRRRLRAPALSHLSAIQKEITQRRARGSPMWPLQEYRILERITPEEKLFYSVALILKRILTKIRQECRERVFGVGFHRSCHGRGNPKKRHFTSIRPSQCVTRKIIKTTERTNLWLLRKLTLPRKRLREQKQSVMFIKQVNLMQGRAYSCE